VTAGVDLQTASRTNLKYFHINESQRGNVREMKIGEKTIGAKLRTAHNFSYTTGLEYVTLGTN
jgi:hypothetical protein